MQRQPTSPKRRHPFCPRRSPAGRDRYSRGPTGQGILSSSRTMMPPGAQRYWPSLLSSRSVHPKAYARSRDAATDRAGNRPGPASRESTAERHTAPRRRPRNNPELSRITQTIASPAKKAMTHWCPRGIYQSLGPVTCRTRNQLDLQRWQNEERQQGRWARSSESHAYLVLRVRGTLFCLDMKTQQSVTPTVNR